MAFGSDVHSCGVVVVVVVCVLRAAHQKNSQTSLDRRPLNRPISYRLPVPALSNRTVKALALARQSDVYLAHGQGFAIGWRIPNGTT